MLEIEQKCKQDQQQIEQLIWIEWPFFLYTNDIDVSIGAWFE